MTDFQYVSDTHLETRKHVAIQRHAPYLILAGDIGCPWDWNYEALVWEVSAKFDHVFIVNGNHEYHNHGRLSGLRGRDWMNHVDNVTRKVCEGVPKRNVTFLQNETYDLTDDIAVFGSTLWTDVTVEESKLVQACLPDYRFIPGFTTDLRREMHSEAVTALSEAIDANVERRFVVVSHHMPRRDLILPAYEGCGVKSAYASDVACAESERILAWFYGHTHTPNVRGKYLCNPIGIPGENAQSHTGRVVRLTPESPS